ncbi:uncharacterized protein LAESUDRAFT_722340 [Laetiporus sulphureus 93-53]|uniref:Uncharacterized protein n=1 Tax=Laetiporus sulphureus 93-53 TaxID=1314785 RepID=A0A165GCS9_9APHY|nr:uncharacterized protein LAESUDRAFT_722340 [Laetiporus sulphureus 93-53]KZT10169.1 hypothetical protein LAESUDRAFT_722340 [Laetiporus sulphureus 93-53]
MIIFTRTCAMISDLVYLVVTWYHSREHLKAVRSLGHHTSLASLLMRNGYLYFAIMLILNVIDIVTWIYWSYAEVITTFMVPISSILISRCLLDLRNAIDNHDDDIDVSDI